ncbi:hypothetical protein QTP86_025019, partial [Hemibagrus guttatus]
MYERSRTVVRCEVGQTEEFKVEVGLHQGSALSPFLFAIVMDQLSEEVRQESPWTMMFADDIVICSESREQMEESLERWRFALERRGMKVSHSKTEYMCVNEREGSGTVRLQGEEVKKVQEFKYLGSTVQSNGECGKEHLYIWAILEVSQQGASLSWKCMKLPIFPPLLTLGTNTECSSSYVDGILMSHNDLCQLQSIVANMELILKAGELHLRAWVFLGQSGRREFEDNPVEQRKLLCYGCSERDSGQQGAIACTKLADNQQSWKIVNELKKIHFTTTAGEDVYFDENGDPAARYDVLNWQQEIGDAPKDVKRDNTKVRAADPPCSIQGLANPPQLSKDGDILIGGIFSFHNKWEQPARTFTTGPKKGECVSLNFREFQSAQTMEFAIEEINNRTDILPGINLGYKIYDACGSVEMTTRAALSLVNGNGENTTSVNCSKPDTVQAIIGQTSSTPTIAISTTVGPLHIPVAVYAVAYALHNSYGCSEKDNGHEGTNVCTTLAYNQQPWKIVNKLKEIHFTTTTGEDVFFDENGDPAARYDVLNWQQGKDGKTEFVKVGFYDASLQTHLQLSFNNNSIVWAHNKPQ